MRNSELKFSYLYTSNDCSENVLNVNGYKHCGGHRKYHEITYYDKEDEIENNLRTSNDYDEFAG